MIIDSIDTVVYTFQFIVPGYVISEVIGAIMPRKKYSEGERIVQVIGYSVFNMGVWYWLFKLIQNHIDPLSVWYWLINAVAVILTGVIVGFALGFIRSKNLFCRLFQKVGINLKHPIPTAWDYKFSEGQRQWVEITVTNGKVLRGIFSDHSMASSESEYRDIYLEELYIKKEGEWIKDERTEGVWINPEEIRYVKFYKWRN